MEIPIVLGFDAHYARPGFTTMQSVLDTANPDNLVSFYVLHDGLNPLIETVAGEMFNTDRSAVQFINIRDYAPGFNPAAHGHITAAGFFRLLIPRIFQGFDKVIWLDSDILVFEDLAPMLTGHPADKPIAACRDYGVLHRHLARLHHYKPRDDDHFNSGVMVYNLPAITEEDSERLIALAPEKHTFHDQDILNKVFFKRVFHLSPRYNWGFLQQSITLMFPPSTFEKYLQEVQTPAIEHFIMQKPWLETDCPHAETYLKLYHKVCAVVDRLTLSALYGD